LVSYRRARKGWISAMGPQAV